MKYKNMQEIADYYYYKEETKTQFFLNEIQFLIRENVFYQIYFNKECHSAKYNKRLKKQGIA